MKHISLNRGIGSQYKRYFWARQEYLGTFTGGQCKEHGRTGMLEDSPSFESISMYSLY